MLVSRVFVQPSRPIFPKVLIYNGIINMCIQNLRAFAARLLRHIFPFHSRRLRYIFCPRSSRMRHVRSSHVRAFRATHIEHVFAPVRRLISLDHITDVFVARQIPIVRQSVVAFQEVDA